MSGPTARFLLFGNGVDPVMDETEFNQKITALNDLAVLMDSQFKIPGTPIRIGLDTLIGLVPGIGDTASLGISLWFVYQARALGVRKRVLTKMLFNIFMDWLIGLVPLIGDIFDIGWKANLRNVALLRELFLAPLILREQADPA